jgi:hypothetical protein
MAASLRRGWGWCPGNIPVGARGDVYLRTLLIHGARAVMRQLARRTDATSRWVTALHARRGFNKAVVALAAKHARLVWALLATGRTYQPTAAGPGADQVKEVLPS